VVLDAGDDIGDVAGVDGDEDVGSARWIRRVVVGGRHGRGGREDTLLGRAGREVPLK